MAGTQSMFNFLATLFKPRTVRCHNVLYNTMYNVFIKMSKTTEFKLISHIPCPKLNHTSSLESKLSKSQSFKWTSFMNTIVWTLYQWGTVNLLKLLFINWMQYWSTSINGPPCSERICYINLLTEKKVLIKFLLANEEFLYKITKHQYTLLWYLATQLPVIKFLTIIRWYLSCDMKKFTFKIHSASW